MEDTGSQGTSLRMRMTWRCPGYVKRDPEDHVKNFQAAAQVERWAMPTWCHMFNSTLIGPARVWFDELPLESIDGYKDLKASFLVYFMQQKKTSQSGMLQSGGLTFEVSQGKDEGLVGPYKNTQGNPRGQSGKVQTATTYGNPGREEKQQQVLRLPQ
ncbi:hypothetical protein Tco_0600665 [Tanacetum coccineum]